MLEKLFFLKSQIFESRLEKVFGVKSQIIESRFEPPLQATRFLVFPPKMEILT